MAFVTPALALAGVLAMSVPILIHLLWRRQRQPIEWAAMRFLMEAWKRRRRRVRVEQILLLAMRCLALLLLGLALARPRFESEAAFFGGGGRDLFLLIDDGLMSGLRDAEDRTALDRHIAHALDKVDALAPGDRVAVLSTARPARTIVHPPSSDLAAVRTQLRGMAPSQAATDVPGSFSLLESLLEAQEVAGTPEVHLLSDFRVGSASLLESLPALRDRERPLRLFASPPAIDPVRNVTVLAALPVRSVVIVGARDGSEVITVHLRRSGGDLPRESIRVRIEGDGLRPVTPRSITFEAGESQRSIDFPLLFDVREDRELIVHATIDADALPIDDQRSTVLSLRRSVRVLMVDRRLFGLDPTLDRLSAGRWIARALEPFRTQADRSSPLEVIETEPAAISLADVQSADAVVLARPDLVTAEGWRLLRNRMERGGVLLVVPPAEVDVHQWTDVLSETFDLSWQFDREVFVTEDLGIDSDVVSSPLLAMIVAELPDLLQSVRMDRMVSVQPDDSDTTTLLRTADGRPLLIATEFDGMGAEPGMIIYLATAPQLDWTNLPAQPLMVPLFQELIRQGTSLVRGRFGATVGDRPVLPGASFIQLPSGEVAPMDASARPIRPLAESGVHVLLDEVRQPLRTLAVEIDPDAARADPQNPDQILEWLNRSGPFVFAERGAEALDAGSSASEGDGTFPAVLLLSAFIALLVGETLFARRLARASSIGPIGERSGIRPTIESLMRERVS